MVPCATCGGSNPEGFRFCGTCGATLDRQSAARGTRKTVTVMFIDVAGSTELGERLDPEMVRRLMGRFYATSRAAIERHGGTVEKFIGDAVMAVFGIPDVHEDAAVRAVRAADEIRVALAELKASPNAGSAVSVDVRIGIETGEVVAGDTQAGEGFATGKAVNIAQRLETTAAPGEILVGDRTLALVRQIVESEPAGPIVLKGRSRPVRAHRVLGVHIGPGQRPLCEITALIGRSVEMAALHAEMAEAMAHQSARLVTVIGMAGVGKSRLVRDFAIELGKRAAVVRGRCLPYGEGITYWPLAELVRGVADIHDEDAPEAGRAKLGALVADEPDAETVVDRIAGAIGLATTRPAPDDVFWAVRRLIQSIAQQGPLLVIFEDIHWAEPTFLDLIEHVARWVEGAAVVIVCLARPELLESRTDWATSVDGATTIDLEALRPTEASALAGELLEGAIDPRLLERLIGATEGNPLFMEELVFMLMEQGHLRQVNGAWHAVDEGTALEIPDTIQGLLAARLDQLPHEERAVAERASVIGRIFERLDVTELSPEPIRPMVGLHLRNLSRRRLIGAFNREDLYRFRHILIRDAAYESLPKEDRADLHERFADWLEMKARQHSVELEELIGYHLEKAYSYRVELGLSHDRTSALALRAGTWLVTAGARAAERNDPRAATGLLTRAAQLLPRDDPQHWRAVASLGVAMADSGRPREGLAMLEQALPQLLGQDAVTAARARLQRFVVRTAVEHPSVAEARGELLPVLCSLPAGPDADRLRAQICMGLGHYYRNEGLARRADWMYRAAVRYAARSDDPITQLNGQLVPIALGMTTLTPAPELIERCLLALRMQNLSRMQRAEVADALAYVNGLEGRFEDARTWWMEATKEFEQLGLDASRSYTTAGNIELMAGDPARAEHWFRAAHDWRNSEGEGFTDDFRRFIASRLAQALLAQGRLDEAEALLDEATAGDGLDRWVDTIGGGTRARLLALRGQPSKAVELATRVVDDARSYGLEEFPMLFGGALEDLAIVLLEASRRNAAAEVLSDVLGRYQAKGYKPGIARVMSLLKSASER
jgi:class 3 adenylate cyclase/tetratricopeptide (TPR) repeat protein